ncbi:MAG: SGNH/GDSL hydrolase family protein [Thermanaeromonas sp.]|uniref:SGNH/GDSL hydrolase family protein n=1 Tax=Thermanaeromonas sp. TaxID=2003697 RepID=UPI00243DCCFF|nr:SGNH/GDSL hydrolase family protein [Thermanaeromonas sp.]MCG0278557.1 SGNH/GDSL hydrolase family protein [Thermanaeromonas sp.]
MAGIDIVGLGDSLTYGYPYGPESSWLALAAKVTGAVVVNKGVNGETTQEMLQRFEEDVLELNPRAVIVLGGTNDAWAKTDVAKVEAQVREMIEGASRAGILPVVALPPPLCPKDPDIPLFFLEEMEKLLEAYRQAYRRLAHSHHLPLLDFYTALLEPETRWGKVEYFIDGAHPNRRGYQVMAEVALPFFRKLKESRG